MAPNQLPAGSHRRRQGTGRSERQRVGLDGSRDGPAARNQAHDSAGSRRDPAQRQGCPRSQGCGSPLPRIVPTGVPFGTGPKRTDRIRPSRASGSRSGGARSTGRRRRERITSTPAPARRGCRRSPCRCVGDHPLWRSPPFGSLRSVPLQRTEQVPAVGGNASDHSLGLKLRYRKPVRACAICHLPASRRRNSSHAHRRIGPSPAAALPSPTASGCSSRERRLTKGEAHHAIERSAAVATMSLALPHLTRVGPRQVGAGRSAGLPPGESTPRTAPLQSLALAARCTPDASPPTPRGRPLGGEAPAWPGGRVAI
jgi:hypothetical protein